MLFPRVSHDIDDEFPRLSHDIEEIEDYQMLWFTHAKSELYGNIHI